MEAKKRPAEGVNISEPDKAAAEKAGVTIRKLGGNHSQTGG